MNFQKKSALTVEILAAAFAFAATPAYAAPDWGKAASFDATVFYTGVSPVEWIMKGSAHGGARALKKGETCASCHSQEAAEMGQRIASGDKGIEPTLIAGKAPSIPVKMQATHDGEQLYLRFTWKEPKRGGTPAPVHDDKNPVKIAVMFEDGGKADMADTSGCWGTCHEDSRTMPKAASETKTKYLKNGNVDSGVFMDLIQWRSGENKFSDGYVATERVIDGGTALVAAEGKKNGDEWVVTFTRKMKGDAKGDITFASGKVYNFGFAIHDDAALGRYHHVSVGFKLGIDAEVPAEEGLNVKKQ